MLIDIHAHMDHCYFKDDIDAVIERARKAGLKVILTTGINPETNRKALDLAAKYDIIKASIGIYPIQNLQKEIDSGDFPLKENNVNVDEEIKYIEDHKDRIVSIGEVGLDYFWMKDNKSEQKELFENMIALAENLEKPIIVHSRKAESDCIEMLKSSKLKKIIMHCFSGKKNLVKDVVDNGWFLTAPTCIVRSDQFQNNAKVTPITQLFCETDAPYLSPFKSNQGNTSTNNNENNKTKKSSMINRNEPAFIVESYKKLAEIKKMEFEEVVKNVYMNWQKVFG